MQKPPPFWMLITALLAGVGLLCAPQEQTSRLQVLSREILRPGQLTVRVATDWCQDQTNLLTARWKGTSDVSQSDVRSIALESRLREALAENAQLRSQLSHLRAIGPGGGQFQPTESLFVPDLVEARVLGEESLPLLRTQAKKLLSVGENQGIEPLSLAIAEKISHIDIGRDQHLQPDHFVLAGQAVAGRIFQVGRMTSTLLPITDTRYRGLARLARPSGAGLEFGAEGILEGDGSDTCRLNFIQSTEPVTTGDSVFTAPTDGSLTTPLLYGTIFKAELPAGAPHWSIRVKPACDGKKLRTVQIVRTRLNPVRLNAQ